MTGNNPYTALIDWFARNAVAANLLMGVLIAGGLFTAFNIKKEVQPAIELRGRQDVDVPAGQSLRQPHVLTVPPDGEAPASAEDSASGSAAKPSTAPISRAASSQ